MISMLDRLRVRTLVEAGHSQGQTADLVGVSLSSVRRILGEPPVECARSGSTAKSRRVGRPSKVAAFESLAAEILEAEPALRTIEVVHRLRCAGYDGGKSAAYALVKRLRPKRQASPMVRFEGLAGEFSQHDFGSVRVRDTAGGSETVHFFASRLKYSRWAEVCEVDDERVESLVRALLGAFAAWGGVPLCSVFDNPKTVVVSRAGGRVDWNPTFAQVAVDYGLGIELCAPRRPNQKGMVENLVGWVKGSFYKVRRFADRADRRAQLAQWLAEGNTQRPNRATGEVPAARLAVERRHLRALAVPPADYPLRFAVTVRTTGFVEHGGVRYAMPPETIGIPATLFVYPERVRVVTRSGVEVEHERWPEVGTAVYRPEDRVARLAAVCGRRARLYVQRQEVLELGPAAEALLTEWVHRPSYNWKQQVVALHGLLVAHGPGRTLAAIERVVAEGRLHVDAIAWLLDREA
jgi:transposase